MLLGMVKADGNGGLKAYIPKAYANAAGASLPAIGEPVAILTRQDAEALSLTISFFP